MKKLEEVELVGLLVILHPRHRTLYLYGILERSGGFERAMT